MKGDRFIDTETRKSLPTDLIEMCARLAESKHLIIVIDSLDVLSLNRDSGSLSYFLSLIDRLSGLANITIIAACRTFDLQYDAKLRDRKWQQKIKLADFDFDEVVAPMLSKWGWMLLV
ncbi:MAG: AAA family ATPase [Candidatus Thiothrix singaporensis]|uniref:AAA family ATPase n=1 Tax=Candidatus Thiothrix singaporensis TaxID=2799669 RepID=A0A7L6AVU2_9GAMM|nr:MAG: AAA family ATPase [Candidatus Thiothrix singaporensis]